MNSSSMSLELSASGGVLAEVGDDGASNASRRE